MSSQPTIIWQIHDGKPGHLNQLRGLTSAISELLSTEVHSLRAPSRRSSLTGLFASRFALGQTLPAPDLIIGAGHSTHFAMLAARRAYGGKAIVLMKPSLPLALFDLCLVPEHDEVPTSELVTVTRGVLNVVRPSTCQDPKVGLFLVGGPSTAHDWSDERMVAQIEAVATRDPSIHWQLTTSRRTPSSVLQILAKLGLPNLIATPHENTDAQWVPEALANSSQVWVSEDSVSMVYEALTSGAAVGVLEVPSKKRGRVAAGMDGLIQSRWVTRYTDWQQSGRLAAPPQQLDEARRCAELIRQRLLSQAAA